MVPCRNNNEFFFKFYYILLKAANHGNLYGFTLDTPLKLHPFTLSSDQDILSPHKAIQHQADE